MAREDDIVELLTAIREGQREQLAKQDEALAMQRRQFDMAEQQYQRAVKLNDRAEQLQDRSAAIMANARRAMMVVLPLIFIAIGVLLWLIFDECARLSDKTLNVGALYTERLLDHARNSRRRGELSLPCAVGKASNRLCGDEVAIGLRVDSDRVVAFGFEADACAMTVASSSMLGDAALTPGCRRDCPCRCFWRLAESR